MCFSLPPFTITQADVPAAISNGWGAMPTSPGSPTTPLTPKLTGTTATGPHAYESGLETPAKLGLELFMASEASAVVEHTKQ